MHIGKRINYLRKKRGITLKELASGIISLSHLSNLQAGRYTASKETLELLAERLDVPNSYLVDHSSDDNNLEILLNDLFNKIITNTDEAYQLLISINRPILSIYQEITYYILECSYFYKTQKMDKAKHIEEIYIQCFLPESESIPDSLPTQLKMAYLYYKGMRNYRHNKLKESFAGFKMLLAYSLPVNIIADIKYNLALICDKQFHYVKAIQYAESALDTYINQALWKKAGEMYNFLGTIYWDITMYDDSIQYLNKALKIAEPMKFNHLIERIYHNIGLVNKAIGKYDSAIKYFNYSFEMKKQNQSANILVTIFEIIRCNLLIEQQDHGKKLIKTAQQYISNPYEYNILLSLQGSLNLLEGNEIEFLTKKKKSLKYLSENSYLKDSVGISKAIGDYYFDKKKYKDASLYYKQELNIMEKSRGGITNEKI